MLVVTSDTIPGYDIVAVFGAVTGTSVGRWTALLLSAPAHESAAIVMSQNRREAIGRMIADAAQSHANAIVGVRMDSMQSTLGVEHCAYGTAVWAVPTTEDARRLYDAMAHEGRMPPLSQFEAIRRRIDAVID